MSQSNYICRPASVQFIPHHRRNQSSLSRSLVTSARITPSAPASPSILTSTHPSNLDIAMKSAVVQKEIKRLAEVKQQLTDIEVVKATMREEYRKLEEDSVERQIEELKRESAARLVKVNEKLDEQMLSLKASLRKNLEIAQEDLKRAEEA